jgi:hypothetical protein
MATVLTNKHVPGTAPVRMSNGLTSVLLDVLCLAACRHAASDWEKRLAYFLVQHDQSRIGLGMADLDVAQFGWTAANFEDEKRFVVAVVDAALTKSGWARLGFEPRLDSIIPTLEKLREMVVAFPASAIVGPDVHTWKPEELPTKGECEVHGVYLHELGCILCNDEPVDAPLERTPHRT